MRLADEIVLKDVLTRMHRAIKAGGPPANGGPGSGNYDHKKEGGASDVKAPMQSGNFTISKATPQDLSDFKNKFIKRYDQLITHQSNEDNQEYWDDAMTKRFGSITEGYDKTFEFPPGFDRAKAIAYKADSGGDTYLAKNKKGDIVGAMRIVPKGDQYHEVTDIVTHPDIQLRTPGKEDKGVGTALMNHAFDRAHKAGKQVYVEPDLGVDGFYKKLGMQPIDKGNFVK